MLDLWLMLAGVLAKATMFREMTSNKFNFPSTHQSLHTQTGTMLHKEPISLTPEIEFSKVDPSGGAGSWISCPIQGEVARVVFCISSIILQLPLCFF